MTQKEEIEKMINQIEEDSSLWSNTEFVNKLNNSSVLPYKFIEKYYDKLDWDSICSCKHISNKFMDKWKYYINFDIISYSQRLNEEFIDKFKDDLDWYNICRVQKMSEDFIINHIEYISTEGLVRNKKLKLSESFWRMVFSTFPTFKIDGEGWTYSGDVTALFNKDFIREFRDKFTRLTGKIINSSDRKLWKEFKISGWRY